MKVFISWSGDTSKAIAEILREWIPSVIQAVKPYFSPDDISKGSRWSSDIAQELQDCSVGLLCLTAENLEAPWIMFEAGALSKSIPLGRVCPLLFGIEPSDVKGPLVQFQAAPFSKDEMKKTMKMMNGSLGDESLETGILNGVFEKWWPDLEDRVKKALEDNQLPDKLQVRNDRDILEEVLDHVRTTTRKISGRPIDDLFVKEHVNKYTEIRQRILYHSKSDIIRNDLQDLDSLFERTFYSIGYNFLIFSSDGHVEYLDEIDPLAGEYSHPMDNKNKTEEKKK